MSKIVLGIDVSKKTLDVALLLNNKTLAKKFENKPKGFKHLAGWLASLHLEKVHACLEATGPYSEAVAEYLHEQGHVVSVVNPLRIKSYAKSDLKRNKTDAADARTIAAFCLTKDPEAWRPLPSEIKQLRDLGRRLESLERMLGIESNRLELASKTIRPSLDRMITNLKQEIEQVRRLIKEHIDNHPNLKQQRELLQTIPGIAEKTATLLLGEIEFQRFDSARAVAAQAGLTPAKFDSGTSIKRTRLSKVGNGRIRKALYFPAICAKRHNRIVKMFAERLARNGKTKKQVVCASMRKLLQIAYGVIKHNRPFDPNLAIYI